MCHAIQGLGLEYARQAVAHGARNLVVFSREPTLPLDTLREFAEQDVALWGGEVRRQQPGRHAAALDLGA